MSWIKATGLAFGGIAAILSFITAPVLPMAVTIGALGLATGVALPALELAHDWKQNKQDAGANGLHYFIKLKS